MQPTETLPEADAAPAASTGTPFPLSAWLKPHWWDVPKITLAVLVVQALLVVVHFSPDLCTNGDNARYYLLGRSLAMGEGLRNTAHPDRPVEQQYPPGFPVLVAVGVLLARSPVGPKVIVAALALMSTLLLSRFLQSHAPRRGRMVIVLSALSPLLLEYSSLVMSELPYLFAVLLALATLDTYQEAPSRKSLLVALAVSILPVTVRGAGIAFCAAYLLHALLSRRWVLAGGHAALFAGYTAIVSAIRGGGSSYFVTLLQLNPYAPTAGQASVRELVERITANAATYSAKAIPQAVTPLLAGAPPQIQATVGIVLALLIAAGIVSLFRPACRIVCLYLAAYAGILLLWPTQWTSTRFLVPVVPFLFLCLLEGAVVVSTATGDLLRRISHRERRPQRRPWRPATAVLFIALFCMSLPRLFVNPHRPLTPDWRNYLTCSDWLRTHTRPGSVVMCRSPELSHLRSEQPSLLYPFTHDVDSSTTLMRECRVRYVIVDSFSWTVTSMKYLWPVLRAPRCLPCGVRH